MMEYMKYSTPAFNSNKTYKNINTEDHIIKE